jgi:thioredoxin-related protein
MKTVLTFALIFAALAIIKSDAGEIGTFAEAKTLSTQSGKPILLEFFKDDCEFCSQAAQDAINRSDIKQALNQVVHFTINFKQGEGIELAKKYTVGIYFPVFFLLNSRGEIIKRWTGYTGAGPFISALNNSLADQTTVDERLARYKAKPTFDDALYFANYYTDIWDYIKANDYYRQARKLSGSNPSKYAFEIFQNTANAVWQDTLEFPAVLPIADSVLALQSKNADILVKVAQIMARLGRKKETTGQIRKYLQAAIDITASRPDAKTQKDNALLKSEYALYVDKDTVRAIDIKKSTMPASWEKSPEEFYGFAKWCLEREINLEQAERFTRQAVQMASPGEFKGKVLSTLASICDARGNHQEAIKQIKLAIAEDPKNSSYKDLLEEFQGGSGS